MTEPSTPISRLALHVLVLGAWPLAGGTGCIVPQSLDLPAPIRELAEPEDGAKYFLYVPSHCEKGQPLPLVVTCHGTPPWDTARRQIQEWADLAEHKRFIVTAPELTGTRGDFLPSPEAQIRRQNVDEQRILSVVRHIQAGYSVMPDRIFLTGWSAGSFAVLHTGLKNPNLFRALAIRQGNFDERYLTQTLPFLDHYQPVYVLRGVTDILVKEQTKASLQWLRDQKMYVFEEETTGSHKRLPETAFRFFRMVIKREPLLQVQAFDPVGGNDMTVAFNVRTSPEPIAYLWQFGDKELSREPEPSHVYKKPGQYEVQLTVRYANKKQRIRKVQIQVPRLRIGTGGMMVGPSSRPASRPRSQPAK